MQLLKKYYPLIFLGPLLYFLVCTSLFQHENRIDALSPYCKVRLKYELYKGLDAFFEKALEELPFKSFPFFAGADLQRIHTGLGKALHEAAQDKPHDPDEYFALLQNSFDHFEKALKLNPNHAFTIFGMAETSAVLETVFSKWFPQKENPYNALAYFRRLREVWPCGVKSHYAFARYLFQKGLKTELLKQVEYCARISPSLSMIRKEAFWSPETEAAAEKGFKQAVDDGTLRGPALQALSDLAESRGDYEQAAAYYEQTLVLPRLKDSVSGKMKLARLYLKAGQGGNANQQFASVLERSQNPIREIGNIYNAFMETNDLAGFMAFAETHNNKGRFLRTQLSFYTAKGQIRCGRYEDARGTLEQINKENPEPEACIMLAQIADREQDWDAMEVYSQKATVLDPYNPGYFITLSNALSHQKKYTQAAHYLEKAIALDPANQTYRKRLEQIKPKGD